MIWTGCWLCWILINMIPMPTECERKTYTNCGGKFNDTRHGYLQTPNFPRPFPVPIRCQWIIEAPPGKTVVVYLTQFYLRAGLRGSEYGDFVDDTNHLHKYDIGVISFDDRWVFIKSSKPFLVLDFELDQIANNNMRVMDYFLDVYGFNITYEIIDKNESVRLDACSVYRCTFNGHCYASSGFHNYSCQCFSRFSGEKCEYGPLCDPKANVSLCGHGRQCRYTFGSQVYGCYGSSGSTAPICQSACEKLNCSQLCVPTPNKTCTCACYTGFRLLRSDNKTCLTRARVRFVGSFRLKNPRFDPSTANKSSSDYIALKETVTNGLKSIFKRQFEEVRNLTVLNFLPDGRVEFHFFGNIRDKDNFTTFLTTAISKGYIDRIAVNTDFVQSETERALNLQELRAEHGAIQKQGDSLSLACISMGTSHLQFQWFKDKVPVNMNTSNHHVWLRTISKNTKDQYTGVLMIDKLAPEDEGTFTCQVSDWGEVQERSIAVTVLVPPRVNVTPLSVTIKENHSLDIFCLVDHGLGDDYGYTWLKNGQILNPSAGLEFVEDIYPTGSRMTIVKASISAVYTCIVSNRAGHMRRDSHITVINSDYPICQPDYAYNLSWNTTAVHTCHIRWCPKNYRGKARRNCSLVDRVPFWEEPDFSECMSADIYIIFNHFQRLKLGYMMTNVTTLLHRILRFLSSRYPQLYPGEGKPILDLLQDISSYEITYPSAWKKIQLLNLRLMMDIEDFLLNSTRGINSAQHAIQLEMQIENQAKSLAQLMGVNKSRSEVKHSFVVEVIKMPTSEFQTFNFPSNNSQFPWFNDFLKLTLETKNIVSNLLKDNTTRDIAVIFYKNLRHHLPKRYLAKDKGGFNIEYMVDSSILSLTGASRMEHDERNWITQVTIKFDRTNAHLRASIDANYQGWYMNCGMADFGDDRYMKAEWILSACNLSKDENYTVCVCNRFGTYALLLTKLHSNQANNENFEICFDCLISVCCIICLSFIFMTTVILTICCRKIPRGVLILKLQVCFGFAGTMASFLSASRTSLRLEWYPFIATALQFFFLLPYSTQVCLELMIYLEITHLYQMQNVQTKIILISWGIPVLVTGATLAAQSQSGFQFESWWIQIGDIYFYGFVITVIILILLYMSLYLIVSAELRHVKLDKSHKGKIIIRSGRVLPHSLAVQLFLITLTIAAILYINIPQLSIRYFLSASIVITGVVVFLLYGIGDCICTYCCCEGDFSTDEISPEPQAMTITKFDPSEECLMENNIESVISDRRYRTKHVLKLTEGKMKKSEDLLPDVASNQKPKIHHIIKAEEENDDNNHHSEMVPLTCVHDTSHLASTSIDDKVVEEYDEQSASLVAYKINPRKFIGTQQSSEFKARTFGNLGTLIESPLEEELTAATKKKPPPVKPKPGKCFLKDSETSNGENKSHKANRVTFGPVFNVPIESEENYSDKATLPPPLRFKDPAPGLLKTPRHLPPTHLKLDSIFTALGSRDLSSGNSPEDDSEGPSREVSSPDSHDTAV